MVLAFHKSLPRFTYSAVNFSPERITRLVECLEYHGYADGNFTLTFDDAYDHLRKVLPQLLDRFNLNIIVFVPTALIGKTNRWDYTHFVQPLNHLDRSGIAELAGAGVRFGTHGHRHVDLTGLPETALREELLTSKKLLEDILSRPVECLSYPFGRVNPTVIEAAAEIGYKSGFTMRFPREDDSPMTRGRFAVYGYDTLNSVLRKIRPGRFQRVEYAKAWVTNRLSGGTVLLNRLRSGFTAKPTG